MNTLLWKSFSDVIVMNTLEERTLMGTGAGERRLRDYFWEDMRVMRLTVHGAISTTLVSPQLTLRLKIGAQTVYAPVLTGVLANLGQAPMNLQIWVSSRGDYLSALLNITAFLHVGGTLITLDPAFVAIANPAEAAIVDLTAQWGTAAIANRIVQRNLFLEYS